MTHERFGLFIIISICFVMSTKQVTAQNRSLTITGDMYVQGYDEDGKLLFAYANITSNGTTYIDHQITLSQAAIWFHRTFRNSADFQSLGNKRVRAILKNVQPESGSLAGAYSCDIKNITILSSSAQTSRSVNSAKGRRNNTKACLAVDEAKSLIQNLRDFTEGHPYLFPSGATHYNLLDIPAIKRDYPVLYLFYQNGFIQLEYNGVHTNSSLTSRGEQLNRQYNGSIPLSRLTLISVNRISCTKNNAQVDVTISAKPTQLALDLFGDAIYKVKPFRAPFKSQIEAKRTAGNWMMDVLGVTFFD